MNNENIYIFNLYSLYSWIHNQTDAIDLKTIVSIAHGISLGMKYLHSVACYGNLKSTNVLLDKNLTAKICDFGMQTIHPMQQHKSQYKYAGSISWMAPEYLIPKRRSEISPKADLYSFGVILWELLTRKIPWQDENYTELNIATSVSSGQRLTISFKDDYDFTAIIKNCWEDGKNYSLFRF